MKNLHEALAHLNQLIGLGCEFPQAVYDTSVAFELNAKAVSKLEEMYDNLFN